MGPTFRNEMCARGILRIALNRPVKHAKDVTCPALHRDRGGGQHRPGRVGARGRRDHSAGWPRRSPSSCGHFDIYVDEIFEKSVAHQVDFLRRVLAA